ncbi:MAG: hypothetical protein U0271_17440 [Polyangiaceae bacterium]
MSQSHLRSVPALVLIAASCRQPEPAAQPTLARASSPAPADCAAPAATVTFSAVPPPEEPASKEICPAATLQARARLDAAFGPLMTLPPPSLVSFCKESPAGAWLIDMPNMTEQADSSSLAYRVEARFNIVFLAQGGGVGHFVPNETLANYGVRTLKEPWTFDYDADGIPELFVEVREMGDEGHQAKQISLVTFKNGAVVPYGPSADFDLESPKDIDDDGRPDLMVMAGYSDPLESCAAGFPMDWPEPLFVAHSVADGTFSFSDAEAKKYVETWCPSAPKTIQSSTDAVCARLWTNDVAATRRKVQKSCTQLDCDREMRGTAQQATATYDCDRRLKFFDKPPPLHLP